MLRTLCRLHPPLRSLSHSLHTPSPSFANRARNPEITQSPSSHTSPFSSSRKRKGGDDVREEAKDEVDVVPGALVFGRDLQSRPRLFVVQPRLRPDSLLNSKLSEALNLAKSLEEQRDGFVQQDFASEKIIPHLVVQNPAARSSKSHADTYFGPGTVDNIKTHMKALESEDQIDAIFVNGILSGIQQRNLEARKMDMHIISWEKPVLDRVGLIIGIFNAHAETKEAKLQSELAALMYKRSRLVRLRGSHGRLTFGMNGESEVVSGRGRGSGGRGSMSGAGETELQLQRRRIQDQRNQLLVQIDEVRRTRALQRSARKRYGSSDGQGLATVAVVGYTNAGKSTLVSALSNSKLYIDDRLFATVDPCLRSVVLPSGRKVLLSDTVGFISDLPVQLVEAFHATLEEVVEADLLMHVLDSSATNFDEQRSSVLEVLQQIGVSEEKVQNMIEVWNKIDLLNKDGTTAQDEACGEGKEAKKGRRTLQDPKEEDEALLKNDADEDGVLLESQENLESDQLFGLHLKENVLSSGHEAASRVEVSAITGVGLKELLLLISKKLDAQKLVVQRSYEPLDRKWRPAHDMESG